MGERTVDRTPEKAWKGRFIERLCQSGNVLDSCRKARIARSEAYEERKADALFAAAWDEALEVATEALELEARRRAEKGVLDPVYQGGTRVGAVRKYSDTLLIFLLKAHKPEKYSERHQMTQDGEVTLRVVHESKGTDDSAA